MEIILKEKHLSFIHIFDLTLTKCSCFDSITIQFRTHNTTYNLVAIFIKKEQNRNMKNNEKLPIILQKVCAGFPSPATDYLEDEINLNEELITNKASTFLIRVSGSSMIEEQIYDGDVLIVDKSLHVKHNSIAVLNYHGQLVVKKIIKKNNKFFLISKFGNQNNFVEITEDNETQVWGIVTYVIHKIKK